MFTDIDQTFLGAADAKAIISTCWLMHDGSVLWPAHYVWEEDQFTVVGGLLAIVALEAKKVSLTVLSISGSQALDTSTATGKLKLAVIHAEARSARGSRRPNGRPLQGPCANRPATG
jgi:hypothetical protein